MADIFQIGLALLAGFILGLFFFGSLWYTTQKALLAKSPALWFVLSFLFRIGLALVGFYYVSQGNWMRTIVCLGGFVFARGFVIYMTKPLKESTVTAPKE